MIEFALVELFCRLCPELACAANVACCLALLAIVIDP